jgi:hypothetical protein
VASVVDVPDVRARRTLLELALLIAAVGRYGVLAHLVAQGIANSASGWRSAPGFAKRSR